MGMKIKTDGCR